MGICTFGAALLLDGCPDSGLCVVREPQPPDFIKALEHKSGLQVSPGDAWRAPLVRPTANVVACLSDSKTRHVVHTKHESWTTVPTIPRDQWVAQHVGSSSSDLSSRFGAKQPSQWTHERVNGPAAA